MATTVTMIPASLNRFSPVALDTVTKKRVAAYARVSTDNEEQMTSQEAQVDYYTKYIQGKNEWEFLGVYADEGISATSTKNRDGFNRMIQDAIDGKIDLILTKSVSRFARNTVDTLTTVRKLKEHGVEVYFEKENIYTFDSKGELLITIMSSLAQEESRSISENVTWGQRKRMADGKIALPYKRFLGYEKGENGLPRIVEDEAIVVRQIFSLFLEGKTPHGIAKILTTAGILTPGGKESWKVGTIKSILGNEKYKGDALLQKSFTVDFLTKKKKVNKGEIPQFYVENSHPAIISTEVFDMVQKEHEQRKNGASRHSGTSIFSSRIYCGHCGGLFGAKVWHSTDKYRKTIWQCNNKFKGTDKCRTPFLEEEDIKRRFLLAVNMLDDMKNDIFTNFESIKLALFDTSKLDAEYDELKIESDDVTELIRLHVNENARIRTNQEEYQKRYNTLAARFETVKTRMLELDDNRQLMNVRKDKLESFLAALHSQELIVTDFNEKLWYSLLEKVTVFTTDDIRFTFKDGTTIKV